MCTCEGLLTHFLHKDFSSSVFAAPGKCSKSGNTYFAAVPATEHINILEKFTCVCRYAGTHDFLTRVYIEPDPEMQCCVFLCADAKDMHHPLRVNVISPNIYLLILVKYLVVLKQLKSMLQL